MRCKATTLFYKAAIFQPSFVVPFNTAGVSWAGSSEHGEQELKGTVGGAVYPDHALTIVGLLTAADAALKHGRGERPGEVVIYTEAMAQPPASR